MSKLALPLAAAAFASWAVYLGGLASIQAKCDTEAGAGYMAGVWGISAGLPCSKVFRFHWFIMSWEFVTIAALAVAFVMGKLSQMRISFVGLFAIGTLLYIEASNTFLTAQSVEYYDNGQPEHRIRTITAGSIMTALCNCFIILALGMAEEAAAPAAAPAAEAKAAAV